MERTMSKEMDGLVKAMVSRDVDQDTCCGIVITLETDENFLVLTKWIKKNPNAGQSEIMRRMYSMLPTVPYYIMPPYTAKKLRKTA